MPSLYVSLTRFCSMDQVLLLRPLWNSAEERTLVHANMLKATQLDGGLSEEMTRLKKLSKATQDKYEREHMQQQAHAQAAALAHEL